MLHKTSQRGVAVSLVAGLLAASAACSPASASQSTPKTTGMSPRSTTARPARSPERTSPGTLSAVADRLVFTRSPSPATSSKLYSPVGVAVDAHGDLFIADTGNYVVEEVTPAGRLSVVAGDGKEGRPTPGPATSSELDGPAGWRWTPTGTCSSPTGQQRRGGGHPRREAVGGRRGAGKSGPPTPGPATSSSLTGRTGWRWTPTVTCSSPTGQQRRGEGHPRRETVGGGGGRQRGPPTPGPATSSELDGPAGVAVDAHGDLFIADTENNVVEEVTPAGGLSVVAGDGKRGRPTPGPATSSQLDEPFGVAADAQGDLFIADSGNCVVEEVTPAGRLSVVAGDGDRARRHRALPPAQGSTSRPG